MLYFLPFWAKASSTSVRLRRDRKENCDTAKKREYSLAEVYNFFILEVVKAWIDLRRKRPRTIHHQGEGVFLVPGRTIKLPSPKTSLLST
jgi:hypothetical protein